MGSLHPAHLGARSSISSSPMTPVHKTKEFFATIKSVTIPPVCNPLPT